MTSAGKRASRAETVSLLVPCFNAERYVQEFVANMREQVRPFDEVIFYDDGSTDGTYALLQQQTLGRVVRGIYNRGPSVARNALLRASSGDCIHFHDIDDWLEPAFLQETLRVLVGDTDVVLTNVRVIDRETGQTRQVHDYASFEQSEDPVGYFLTHCCYAINGLYRRSILEKIGGFRETLSRDEDPDLHIRLAHAGARIAVVPVPLAINRVGEGTYSSNSFPACWREHLKALRYYTSELPERYHPLLRTESARMVGISAPSDLTLAHDYRAFCESLGGHEELSSSMSAPIRLLARFVGYRRALDLRFGRPGSALRKLWPGRIG